MRGLTTKLTGARPLRVHVQRLVGQASIPQQPWLRSQTGATVAWQNATVYFCFRSFLYSDLVLSSMTITPAASTLFLSRSIPVRMTLCSPTDRVLVST